MRLRPYPRRAAWAVAAAACALLAPAGATGATVSGAWSQFGKPRAVYVDDTAFVGLVTAGGDVGVARVGPQGRPIQVHILWRRFGRDDHNSPALWVRPDGRIVAFWSPHSGYHLPRGRPSRLYYRISCAPAAIGCFGPLRRIRGNTGGNALGYTYPSPVYVPATHTLWLFWRGGDWQPTYARSRDGGLTWSRPRGLLCGGRKVYAVYAADGRDGFHVAVVPDNPSVSNNSLYYLHYSQGRWLRADGSVVSRLGERIPLQQGEPVFSSTSVGGGNAWVLDVAQDGGGRPVILYRRADGTARGYWYARWTGEQWATYPIVASGLLHGWVHGHAVGGSIGGATLDHADPSVVYLSRVAGSSAQIFMAVTADGGALWSLHPLSGRTGWPNLHPIVPLGEPAKAMVLWMHGRYANFHAFFTEIRQARPAMADF